MTTTLARFLLWLLLLVLSCQREPPRTEKSRKPRVEVTLLATGDEDPKHLDRLLAQWKAREKHCVDGDCLTLALSTDGHRTPLEAIGYVASANLAPGSDLVVERGGVRFAVIGVSRHAGPDAGVETVLQREVPRAYSLAPTSVVVSDLCVKELAEILERNGRAWPFLIAVIGRTCASTPPARTIYSTLLLAAPDGLDHGYGKATLSFDQRTSALLRAEGAVVPLDTP